MMNTTTYALAGAFDDLEWLDDGTDTNVTGSDNYSTPSDNTSTSSGSSGGGGGFFAGTNFMGLLQTIGGTWAQIESAKRGQQVIVRDSNGQTRDIAPQLLQRLEQQAQANQTSVDNLMKMMQMQMLKEQNQPKPKNNTSLYIALGVTGAILLAGGIYIVSTSKKKK